MHSGNRHGPAIRHCALQVAIVLALGMLPVPQAGAGHPHERDGVMAGIAIGVGTGKVSLFPGNEELAVESGWETGVTPELRLGYVVVKNRLAITVTNQQWLYEQGILAEDKLRINAQNWSLCLTWYPGNMNRASGGLYVVGGIGMANARLTLLEPIEDDPHGNKFEEIFKEDERGTAYQIGLGYEFRLGKAIAAGLSAAYIHSKVGGEIFEKADVIPVNLTLNWYW